MIVKIYRAGKHYFIIDPERQDKAHVPHVFPRPPAAATALPSIVRGGNYTATAVLEPSALLFASHQTICHYCKTHVRYIKLQ